jgi:hypothetical protein
VSSGITRNMLGPDARAHYDQQKAQQQTAPNLAQRSAISARTKKGTRDSALAASQFINICEKAGLPKPELEWRFHPSRLWRFDVAFVAARVAIEIQGGIFLSGRHNHSVSFIKDMEKANSAACMGWVILYRTPSNFLDVETVELARRALRRARLL